MKIAQTIPGLQDIFKCNPVNPQPGCSNPIQKTGTNITSLGDLLSGLLNIAFYLAIFIAFYFLVWGAFAYIAAQGNKENLAKARARITYAIIGLIVVLMAFFIAKFAGEILQPRGGLPF